jgi:hypothetical protein
MRTHWTSKAAWMMTVLACAGGACEAGAAGTGPDLTVSAITGTNSYGAVGGVRGYSVAGTLCNMGDAPVGYSLADADHPVVAQNLYRLVGGRFEQIGMSWLFNTTIPLDTQTCGPCTPTGGFGALGVGCSDPHGAGLAGSQSGLSRRSEVDPTAGSIAFPQDGVHTTGDAVFKRLQVRTADLQADGARYFVELQCVAPDDAAAGNGANNASWREVAVNGSFGLAFVGPTVPGAPAIFAWADAAGAMVTTVDVPGGGRLHVGSAATDRGDGTWSYWYVVHNLDTARGVGGFAVPFAGDASELAFRDVEHHSGEPYDGTDWDAAADGSGVSWSTDSYADNPDANAVRWGTAYAFGFVSDRPPVEGAAALSLFAPGTSDAVEAAVWLPGASCAADFAEPFGALDFFDLAAFLQAFNAADPAADLADPAGVFNFFDVAAYIGLYNAGCP